jgi:hypothetical protein
MSSNRKPLIAIVGALSNARPPRRMQVAASNAIFLSVAALMAGVAISDRALESTLSAIH